jgi:CheY-like chemotaxis protein
MIRIHIIDDEADLRSEIAERFMFEGFETIESADGMQAIDDALRHRPDIILCDIWMPRMDGFGVLETVRSHPELRHIPFIVMTSLTDYEIANRVQQLGANHYVSKPFSFPDLIQIVRHHTVNNRH